MVATFGRAQSIPSEDRALQRAPEENSPREVGKYVGTSFLRFHLQIY